MAGIWLECVMAALEGTMMEFTRTGELIQERWDVTMYGGVALGCLVVKALCPSGTLVIEVGPLLHT